MHEINVMTSDYALALFKTYEDKVKSVDSGVERNTARVRHIAFSIAPDSAKNLNGYICLELIIVLRLVINAPLLNRHQNVFCALKNTISPIVLSSFVQSS